MKALAFVVLLALLAQASDMTLDRAIGFLDSLYRSETSYAELSMSIVTPDWERTLSMEAWTEGMDRTLIRITAPAREEGIATLCLRRRIPPSPPAAGVACGPSS